MHKAQDPHGGAGAAVFVDWSAPGELHTGVAEWRRCLRLIGHFLYAFLIDWLFNSRSGNWPLVSFVIVVIIFDG